MTPEEVTKNITSLYDSVDLINSLNNRPKPLSFEDTATMIRNTEHLKIMMQKDWFIASLTSEQIIEIELLIV